MSSQITRKSKRVITLSTVIVLASAAVASAHDSKASHPLARHTNQTCTPQYHPRWRKCLSTPLGAHRKKTAPATVVSTSCNDTGLTPDARDIPTVETATLCLVNQVRRQHDLAALAPNADLLSAAERHAHDMLAHDYFADIGPAGDTPLSRIEDAGYLSHHPASSIIGENIAWGAGYLSTPASIVTSWINSPAILANILEAYTNAGTAIAAPALSAGEQPVAVYTQDYGYAGNSASYAPSMCSPSTTSRNTPCSAPGLSHPGSR